MLRQAAAWFRPENTVAHRTSPLDRLSLGASSLLVFLAVLFTHAQFPIYHTYGDALWALPSALSLLREGNLDLVEYQTVIDDLPGLAYTIRFIDGVPYNTYPFGVSLLALPFVAAFDWLASRVFMIDLYATAQYHVLYRLDVFIGCIIVALASVFIYRIARLYLSNGPAFAIVFIFAFCTSALSIASRDLNQHGPTMLMLSAALYGLLRAPTGRRYLLLAGFALAFAFMSRQTNSVPALVLTAYVVIQHRLRSFWYFLGAGLVALVYFYGNYTLYGSPMSPHFSAWALSRFGTETLVEGLLGHWISPNRGLLIFSPVLLFSFVGLWLKVRDHAFTRLDSAIVLVMLLHWLVISAFEDWYAGHAYGPRYMADLLPYFAYFLIPFFDALPRFSARTAAISLTALLLTVGVSLFIHLRGAIADATQAWNAVPLNVDVHRYRAWDWRDLQILRGLNNIPPIHLLTPQSSYRLEFDTETMPYQASGWYYPERFEDGTTHQWMVEREASLWLRLETDRDMTVQMRVLMTATPEVRERFEFTVNGQPIPLAANGDIYTGYIPASVLRLNGDGTELRWTVPYLVRPSDNDPQSADSRTLGLALDYLEVKPYEAPTG